MSKVTTEYKGKTYEISLEDARSYIINAFANLQEPNPLKQYGYDIFLQNLIMKYAATDLGMRVEETHGPCDQVIDISPIFIEAGWDLCRLGILSPYTKTLSGQAMPQPGLSITSYGREWIKASKDEEYTPVETERFGRALSKYKDFFGKAYYARALEALNCYHSHNDLASCVMSGGAAEAILIATAEHLNIELKNKESTDSICNKIIALPNPEKLSGVERTLKTYSGIIKIWRDSGIHHKEWSIDSDQSYLSLKTLLLMAIFCSGRWFANDHK